MIPYGRQTIDESDVAAVVATLRGDWLTTGPALDKFELDLADVVSARYAVAFSSGTAALHGACAAAGLGPDDYVATSTLSFVASANCARFVGANVELLDICPETLNFDPQGVPPGLDALVAVHYAGLPVDLSVLPSRPRVVIEDASHALGAHTPSGPVGNCAHSDMTCFSFHPVKAITTGEGGAVTTNDDALARRLRQFRNHAISRRPERGDWYYEIAELGVNYRLTDFQAALGSSQLRKLARFVEERQRLAERYRQRLTGAPVGLPPAPRAAYSHAYHIFPIRIDERDRVFKSLRSRGIGVQVHYIPIHHQPIYSGQRNQLPHADEAYRQLLTLPLFPSLTEAQQDHICDELVAAIVR